MSEHGRDPTRTKVPSPLTHRQSSQSPSVEEKADWIGRQLREVYDETVNEPIPDRLQELLRKLERNEGEG